MEDSTSPRQVIDVMVQDWDGREVRENLLVEPIDGECLRVVYSPGLVQGIAAGDIVRYDPTSHTVSVIERGGNVVVQFFYKEIDESVLAHIEEQVCSAGGSVDGRREGLRVFTFPVSVGFSSIEGFMALIESSYEVEWMFGNVYDKDGAPLNWWR